MFQTEEGKHTNYLYVAVSLYNTFFAIYWREGN